MRQESETDVLIVGLGPVGASAACLLGRHGVRTHVVDRADGILMAPRAIALDHEALRILQACGLPQGAFETVPIPVVRMVSPELGEFARFDTAGTTDCHPKLVTFYQPELEHALFAKLSEDPHVTSQRSLTLVALDDTGPRVTATLRDAAGTTHIIRARYVIGADGASSTVRKLLGIALEGSSYSQDWLVVDVRNSPGAIDDVEFHCDPARPAPHMVAPGGRQRWEFMLHEHEGRDAFDTDEGARRLLAQWSGSAAPVEIERRAIYRFHARVCERFQRGRVFLVGDAAHLTPPFVGQGLVAGLRDVSNLCWKLAWVLRHGANAQILASYDEERRPHATRMIDLARAVGVLLAPPSRAAGLALHGAMRALRGLPLVRRYLDGMEAKPRNRPARGLFVAGKARGPLARASQLPQLRLTPPEGGATQLSDDVLGGALTCVGFGVDPSARIDAQTRAAFIARGGRFVQLGARSGVLTRTEGAYALAEDEPLSELVARGWVALVRPDWLVMNDGPAQAAAEVLRSGLALLDAPRGAELVVRQVSP